MKKIVPTIMLALLAVACRQDGFTISGTLEGGAGKTLWLEEIAPEGPMFIDSIPMDSQGRFKYRYNPPYRSLYNLHTSESHYIVTLPDKGEHIEVTGRWDNISMTYSLKGSPESLLLWQLQQYTNDGKLVLQALVDTTEHYARMLAEGLVPDIVVSSKKHETDSIYRATFVEQQDYVCRFIEENQGSLATLIALYKPFNNRALIDPRDPNSIEYYDLVLEGLQQQLPDNPHTLRFKNTTERHRSALARMEE